MAGNLDLAELRDRARQYAAVRLYGDSGGTLDESHEGILDECLREALIWAPDPRFSDATARDAGDRLWEELAGDAPLRKRRRRR